MKNILYILFLILVVSCEVNESTKLDSLEPKSEVVKTKVIDNKTLKYDSIISLLPYFSDTSDLIEAIKNKYNLENGEESWAITESITKCSLINIGRLNKQLVLVEYDFADGCMAAYPWKYQILIEPKTSIALKIEQYKSIEIVDFDGEKMILGINQGGKGYGSHEILRLRNDTLINIFEHIYSTRTDDGSYNRICTVDSHSDDGSYPNPLKFKIVDINSDGHSDFQLSGIREMFQKRTKNGDWVDSKTYKTKVTFNYIYNVEKAKFQAHENYQKKYSEYYR